MKVGSQDLSKPAGELVVIPRGDLPALRFFVTAPPLGRGGHEFILFPDPSPPEEYAKKPDGGVLFDENKRPVVKQNREDPQWLATCERQARRRVAYQVAMALANDSEVEFDADANPGRPIKQDDAAGWARYCDALLEEFDAANLNLGILKIITRKSSALASPTVEELAAARDRFFSQQEEGTSPTLRRTLTEGASVT